MNELRLTRGQAPGLFLALGRACYNPGGEDGMLIDQARIFVKAGDGGNGCASFGGRSTFLPVGPTGETGARAGM